MTLRIFLLLCINILLLFGVDGQQNTDILTSNRIEIEGKSFYLYKVRQGEGLYRISKSYGISQQALIHANVGIEKGLKVGQIIKVPVIEGKNSSLPELLSTAKNIHHVVEPGQNLFFISRKYNVTVSDIIKLNPRAKYTLQPGMELTIPYKEFESKTQMEDENYIYHLVKPKETLFMLSKKYKVIPADIIEHNPGLKSGVIKIGESLRIPKKGTNKVTPITPSKEPQITLLEDSSYIYHRLKYGETLYSLSKKYNIATKDLKSVNQIADVTDIKLGYIIRIPKLPQKEEELPVKYVTEGFKIHVTKERRESIKQLIKTYNCTVDELIALNPDISAKRWNKLKRNTRIKIPNKVAYVIKPKDPKPVEKPQDEFSKIIFSKSNCADGTSVSTVNIAFLLPFYTGINDTINTITTTDSLGNIVKTRREQDIILPSTSIVREFYNGALLAIDSLKKQGINVNVLTLDTKLDRNDNKTIYEVLKNPELAQAHIIFGPAYPVNISLVSDYAKEKEIRLVLPFGDHKQVLDNNPYVFALHGENNVQYMNAISHLGKDFNNTNIYLVKDPKGSDRQTNFLSILRDEVYLQKMENDANIRFYELNFSEFGRNGIGKIMSRDRKNLVIIPSQNVALFNTVLPNLNYLKSKRKYPITMFGFPEWMKYSETNLEFLFNLNSTCFTNYFTNYEDSSTLNFLGKYQRWFGSEPTITDKEYGMIYPNNGILGFDAVYYFGNLVHQYGPSFETCMPSYQLNLIQSNFNFERINNWSGFMNNYSYYIKFSETFDLIDLKEEESDNWNGF